MTTGIKKYNYDVYKEVAMNNTTCPVCDYTIKFAFTVTERDTVHCPKCVARLRLISNGSDIKAAV